MSPNYYSVHEKGNTDSVHSYTKKSDAENKAWQLNRAFTGLTFIVVPSTIDLYKEVKS